MDYTLAQYKPDTFELLAHRQTIDKLVTAFGYPPELYDFEFDHRYMMRGLIIDKVRVLCWKVNWGCLMWLCVCLWGWGQGNNAHI